MATCKNCIHDNACTSIFLFYGGNAECNEQHVEKFCKCFEDRSRFVELPCKVGDRVWINGILGVGRLEEHEITKVQFSVDSRIDLWFHADLVGYKGKANCCFQVSEIGKTVFLSREEAEQAMTERSEANG